MATTRTLGLLAAVLAVALLVNGYYLYQAFKASAVVHYRLVIKPDNASVVQPITSELTAISGVTVNKTEDSHSHHKPTGHFWVGKEVAQDVAVTIERDLAGLHRRIVREDVDGGNSIVRLGDEYGSKGEATKVQHQVNVQLKLLTLNIVPSFKVDQEVDTVLDVMLTDSSKIKAVQAAASKHDLPLQAVDEQP